MIFDWLKLEKFLSGVANYFLLYHYCVNLILLSK